MIRSMMQIYARNSAAAVELYRTAFRAELGNDWRNPDGSCAHVEINAYGQLLAVSEAPEGTVFGDNLQFCLHLETDEAVRHAYAALQPGAKIIESIGACPYSECMFALIDRFGVHWCVFA